MRSLGQFEIVLFFFMKRFYTHNKHKNAQKRTKSKKAALKKHPRRKRLLIRLFAFLVLFVLFGVFFVLFSRNINEVI